MEMVGWGFEVKPSEEEAGWVGRGPLCFHWNLSNPKSCQTPESDPFVSIGAGPAFSTITTQ